MICCSKIKPAVNVKSILCFQTEQFNCRFSDKPCVLYAVFSLTLYCSECLKWFCEDPWVIFLFNSFCLSFLSLSLTSYLLLSNFLLLFYILFPSPPSESWLSADGSPWYWGVDYGQHAWWSDPQCFLCQTAHPQLLPGEEHNSYKCRHRLVKSPSLQSIWLFESQNRLMFFVVFSIYFSISKTYLCIKLSDLKKKKHLQFMCQVKKIKHAGGCSVSTSIMWINITWDSSAEWLEVNCWHCV